MTVCELTPRNGPSPSKNPEERRILSLLDTSLLCHVGLQWRGHVSVLPMRYARVGSDLYLDGPIDPQIVSEAPLRIPVSIAVTHIDGMVLAKSASRHSIGYRSILVSGTATILSDPSMKLKALKLFTESMVPGRWAELRAPTVQELATMNILHVRIEELCSTTSMDAFDEESEDRGSGPWTGVLPMFYGFGRPIPDGRHAVTRSGFDMTRVAKHGQLMPFPCSARDLPTGRVKGLA